jgi:hypothetical protein
VVELRGGSASTESAEEKGSFFTVRHQSHAVRPPNSTARLQPTINDLSARSPSFSPFLHRKAL